MDYRPEKVYIYGPPKSVRGRLANRLRRLLDREESVIVYYVLDVDYADNSDQTVNFSYTADGRFTVTDISMPKDMESPGSTPTVQG